MASEKPQPREMRGGKASIYWAAPLGTAPVEVTEWRVEVRPVNIDGARAERPYVEYRRPKKRIWEKAPVEAREVTIVVLEGWGHGGPKRFEEGRSSGGFVTQSSLYASFDPRWKSDYFEWIDRYIALHASADDSSARVLADYRGWGQS